VSEETLKKFSRLSLQREILRQQLAMVEREWAALANLEEVRTLLRLPPQPAAEGEEAKA